MRPIYVTKAIGGWKLQFEYHPRLVEIVKRIPDKQWQQEGKCWFVPDNMVDRRGAKFFVDAFCAWAVNNRLASLRVDRKDEEISDFEIPPLPKLSVDPNLLIELRDYQKEGVAYAVEKKRCIFGDQPGLGKTAQAIASVKVLDKFPCLVICPNSLKVNWQREFKKFAGIDSVILDNSNRNTWTSYWEMKKMSGEAVAKVFIVNFESVKKYFVSEMNRKNSAMTKITLNQDADLIKSVIIDESHRCKSSKTQQSKIIGKICYGKEVVFALTGTPFVNANTDYINQLKIIGRLDDFGGWRRFVSMFCDGPNMTSNSKLLNVMLRRTCFFRREKKDVLKELPPKSRQYITCEISNKSEYKMAERDIADWLKRVKKSSDREIARTLKGETMTKIGILKQISARGKLAEFISFCHDMTDGGDKLIVFGFLKDVISAIHNEFRDCSVIVTGDCTIEQKQEAVDRFQNDPSVKIIILNYKSGGVGLTLTAASRVAFIEFPWTYADCEQAEDRAHRLGQHDNVDCYYFLGKDTIDTYLYDTIIRKKSGANESTGTDEQTEESMVNLCLGFFSDKIK